MNLFLDASALVKRYIAEADTAQVRELLASGRGAISRLSVVELASAVRRRQREGGLAAPAANQVLASFQQDAEEFRIVEILPDITARAWHLLAHHPLRAGDAIQLASALALQSALAAPVEFLCFDRRLAAAAAHEGLAIS